MVVHALIINNRRFLLIETFTAKMATIHVLRIQLFHRLGVNDFQE